VVYFDLWSGIELVFEKLEQNQWRSLGVLFEVVQLNQPFLILCSLNQQH
jgi:hypothetical protein